MSQLSVGIKVEAEHKATANWIRKMCQKGHCPANREIYKKIAQNHISEHKNYYAKLKTLKL
jgi:hypothetical protein